MSTDLLAAPCKVETYSPLFLMVGVVTGCNAKEAGLYVRSLAARYVVCAEQGYFRVVRDGERFLFEIQEGGKGLSVLEQVQDHLAETNEIIVHLANDRYVAIQSDNGQFYSLFGTEGETQSSTSNFVEYSALLGPKKLTPLIRNKEMLTHFGLGLSVASIAAFGLTLFVTVVGKTYLQDKYVLSKYRQHQIEAHAEASSPLLALIKAKSEASEQGRSIGKLEFKKGGWSWELQ